MPKEQAHAARRTRMSTLREVGRGVATLWQGVYLWGTSRRLVMWGIVPGAVVAMLLVVLAVVIIGQLPGWAGSAADAVADPEGWVHGLVQAVVAFAILAATLVFIVYTYAALTLAVGQPFFERISRAVDADHAGSLTEPDQPWYKAVVRGVGEAVLLGLLTLLVGVGLFVLGLIPVVGAVASFVVGMACGGWFLALELTAYPLARRGFVTLAERRAVLASQRPLVIGFGAAVFVVFLLPLGAVVLMPAAVAGATRLTHQVAGADRGGGNV